MLRTMHVHSHELSHTHPHIHWQVLWRMPGVRSRPRLVPGYPGPGDTPAGAHARAVCGARAEGIDSELRACFLLPGPTAFIRRSIRRKMASHKKWITTRLDFRQCHPALIEINHNIPIVAH